MIICDLWVINGVLTNKNVFSTNRVVYMVGGRNQNNKTEKFEIFMSKKVIGYKNYGVKIHLTH